jgi:hypothetical protein
MSPLPDSLRSPKNLIALGAGFLLAIFVWWLWTPSDTDRTPTSREQPRLTAHSAPNVLDRIEFAMRNVRAWRVTSIGRINGQLFQTDEDVVCPSDSHAVTKALSGPGAGTVAEEFIATRNTVYAREGAQPWHSQPDNAPDKCKSGPMAGSQPLVELIDGLKKNSVTVNEGPVIKFEGGTCRLWELSSAASLPMHSICVDEVTGLPRELQLGGLRVEYSNWNQAVDIEPPDTPKPGPSP